MWERQCLFLQSGFQIPNQGFTHAGKFHADDVFSAALLRYLNPQITFLRGYEVPQGFTGIVFDIGGGPFDHHQKGSPVRENGVPYASFGLLWRQVGEGLLGKRDAKRFDEGFIQPLDQDDNTGCGNQIAGIISAYNPLWDEPADETACFEQAVEFALVILRKKFAVFLSVQRAAQEVGAALAKAKDGIVIMERYAPWKQRLIPSRARFVIFPSQRGGYCAQTVPQAFGRQDLRVPFPEAWAGASEQELPAISGIETLRFCHIGRFMVTTGTLEDAVAACKAAEEWQRGKM